MFTPHDNYMFQRLDYQKRGKNAKKFATDDIKSKRIALEILLTQRKHEAIYLTFQTFPPRKWTHDTKTRIIPQTAKISPQISCESPSTIPP